MSVTIRTMLPLFSLRIATKDRITTRSPGNGAPVVGAYNAEGNAPTAGAELLRCNAKVIRPGWGQ